MIRRGRARRAAARGSAWPAWATAALAVLALGGCASSDPDPNAVGYPLMLPTGFPAPPAAPSTNPLTAAKALLGRYLFYDTRMSANQTYACSSCHAQARAFSDGRTVAVGSTGQYLRRNAMSLTNVAYDTAYTWANPLIRTLEQQALIPMFGEAPVELGLADNDAAVLARLRADARYPAMFHMAFPDDADPVSVGNVVKAVASFERTLISANSAYDQWRRGDASAMSASAQRGLALFTGERLECYHCHTVGLFTDSAATSTTTFPQLNYYNTGLYNVDGHGAYPASDQGEIEITGQATDMGRFRAPTLRNIALTAPYMHDGSIPTLEGVLAHYGAGGRTIASGPNAGVGSTNPHKNAFVLGFTLSDQDQADVLAFLQSLTDWDFVQDPRFASPFTPQDPTAVACPSDVPAACPAGAPGYASTIAPLIQARCAQCHTPGGPGTNWPLTSYSQVSALQADMLTQLGACRMPPPDAPLTSDERAELLAWLVCGAPAD